MGLIIPQALLFLVHNYAEYKGFQKYTYHIIAKKKKKKSLHLKKDGSWNKVELKRQVTGVPVVA